LLRFLLIGVRLGEVRTVYKSLFLTGVVVMVLCTYASDPKAALTAHAAEQNRPRLLAYYVSWQSDYRADNIPYHQLTHLNHAFILPQADGSLLVPAGPPPYLEPPLVEQAHAAGVKVLASIGGYGGSENFPLIARDPRLRATLADNIASFLRTHNYDGVDIDWEFPQDETDRANQNLLIKAIRDNFNSSPAPGPS
jgi:GH18 family chitinase